MSFHICYELAINPCPIMRTGSHSLSTSSTLVARKSRSTGSPSKEQAIKWLHQPPTHPRLHQFLPTARSLQCLLGSSTRSNLNPSISILSRCCLNRQILLLS